MKSLLRIKVILSTLISLLFISCEDNYGEIYQELSFDLRLSKDGRGYHHLTLNRDTWQTLHRVTGSVKEGDKNIENFWVRWESDLYWYLGDTLGYIVNRNFNNYGEYVSVDTSYMIGFDGQEVATSNIISYSNSKGELNNMIAPVKSMVGDTMKLTAYWYDGGKYDRSKDFYIILD